MGSHNIIHIKQQNTTVKFNNIWGKKYPLYVPTQNQEIYQKAGGGGGGGVGEKLNFQCSLSFSFTWKTEQKVIQTYGNNVWKRMNHIRKRINIFIIWLQIILFVQGSNSKKLYINCWAIPPVSSFNSEHEFSGLYQLPTTFPCIKNQFPEGDYM